MSLDQTSPDNGVKALADYLNYYKKLESPGFALLVAGEWGAGKTYQVKAMLEGDKPAYVSLFGLRSNAEIRIKVLVQLDKKKGWLKSAEQFLKGKNVSFMGFGGSAGDFVSDTLSLAFDDKLPKNSLVVLDDFERASNKDEILGLINQYVEHMGCRVVVIANEEKVDDGFKEQKEKVFGHTITVQAQVNAAFEHFFSKLGPEEQGRLVPFKQEIVSVFLASGSQSLRILRNVLAASGMFSSLFEEDQISNHAEFRKILMLFFAIAIEVQRGDMARDVLADRIRSYTLIMAIRSKQKPDGVPDERRQRLEKFGVSHERYKLILDIGYLWLSNDLLVEMIFDGRFCKSRLQQYLAETQQFLPPNKQPGWRRVYELSSHSDVEVDDAAREIDGIWENRTSDIMGEILHIWSLRIMRTKNGLMKPSETGHVGELTGYFDDLVHQSRFALTVDKSLFLNHPAYGGYGLWRNEENTEMLIEAFAHAEKCARQMLEKKFPEIRSRILDVLRDKPQDFESLLNGDGSKVGEFDAIPVLLAFAPTDYLHEFLKLPVDHWLNVTRVLRARRGRISPNGQLRDELAWFNSVEQLILAEVEKQKDTWNAIRLGWCVPFA